MFLSGENTLAVRFDALHRAFGGGQRSVCSLRSCVGSVGRLVFSGQSLSCFAPKFSAFALPAKRGEFWLKNGEENRNNSHFFGASSPVFPIATPPLFSQPVSFRPAPPTARIDVVAELCSPLRIEQLPGRFALDTRRTRIIRGHIDRLLRRRETKTPPVYENRPRAGIGMCRHRSRNCRATAQRLPLRLPKSPVNPRRRRKSL